jgi:hypothetical protein
MNLMNLLNLAANVVAAVFKGQPFTARIAVATTTRGSPYQLKSLRLL